MKKPYLVEIIKLTNHPDSKKLKLCTVTDNITQEEVVCGANNAREGLYTILAPIDTQLPNGIIIKEQNLRGVISKGMLCSAKDLGISEETGIVDIPKKFNLGEVYSNIPVEYLSSIPWYNYKEVETFWINLENKTIKTTRNLENNNLDKNWKQISKTYFHENKYLYRNFKYAF